MSNLLIEAERLSDLRQRALSRLTTAPRQANAWPSATVALGVLHELASSPDKAADALALLHELQVHQVELDLQDEELRHSRVELEAALHRQMALFEHAPFAYLVLDAQGSLREVNQAGLQLLGLTHDELLGQPLQRWLSPGSADRLHSLLASVALDRSSLACELQLLSAGGGLRFVHAQVAAEPDGAGCLLALTNGASHATPNC